MFSLIIIIIYIYILFFTILSFSQASPFIFTKVNSLPTTPVTTPTAATPTPVPKCPHSLPVWVPVVVAIVSLLAGITVGWHVFSCTLRRKKSGEDTEIEVGSGTNL